MNKLHHTTTRRLQLATATFVGASFLTASAPWSHAEEKGKPVWTDLAKATAEDPDFSIQGEYVGKVGEEQWGAQVIAQGKGEFKVTAYPGGLPGDGFTGEKDARLKGKAERKPDGSIAISAGDQEGVIKEGKITGPSGTMTKVERKSPTMGAKPPEGALVLFDGKSADAFKNGTMEGDLLCQGVTSKALLGSGSLHIEFMLPYQPQARGQGRGNSGCYLQGRYEVQMLDSFGLEGENNECGGIYTISKPKLNMAFPPLTWQTYDIDFTAANFGPDGKKLQDARITVKHNGVVIQENVALTLSTTASPVKEGPEEGPLYLQDHGNPVRYRNIWWVPASKEKSASK